VFYDPSKYDDFGYTISTSVYPNKTPYTQSGGNQPCQNELFLYPLLDPQIGFDVFASLAAQLTSTEKKRVQSYRDALGNNRPLKVNGTELEPERLKNVFKNYFALEAAETLDLGHRHEELSLEFAFSQLFSPKQKELFQKKLKGEPLSKTEREYFSRVVRKKSICVGATGFGVMQY
jgi:hypothetical protein